MWFLAACRSAWRCWGTRGLGNCAWSSAGAFSWLRLRGLRNALQGKVPAPQRVTTRAGDYAGWSLPAGWPLHLAGRTQAQTRYTFVPTPHPDASKVSLRRLRESP